MRILVIYYSLEGNTRFIAESIAGAVNADILELKPKVDIKSKGFMKYLWGGKEVVQQKEPELNVFDIIPQEYDVIFIGTPVWAWTYTPALRSFFSFCKLANRKIALFCSHDGQKAKTFEKMAKALSGNTILGEADFEAPLKNDRTYSSNRAKEWAKEITVKAR
jgi:flavodoxin